MYYIMDIIKTPRAIPEDIECWSDEIEKLLSEWGEVSMCYAYLHNFGQRKYKRKYHHLQIPIIILSTLTGTANFATDSYVPESFRQGFSAGVGSLNLFCGILGTLLSFLRYSEIYEGHRISALAWSKLSRTIEIELSLQDKKRKPCRDFLKICRAEYDNLLECSPSVDLDIISMFNKKFEGKYKDVRRPLICNGLKEIKAYNQPVVAKHTKREELVPQTDRPQGKGKSIEVVVETDEESQ
tara:strand:+ start:1840 stop:2559 length:720 start_codon:yes stop_codon:yes gene_type:complete